MTSTELRQWCPECEAMTANIVCPGCVGQAVACARCGTHPGHMEPGDDDDEDWPDVDD